MRRLALGDALVKEGRRRYNQQRTTSLDTLNGSIGDSSVDCLSSLLDGVNGRLLEAGVGAEEAGVTDDA
jgi:hypothetical protein